MGIGSSIWNLLGFSIIGLSLFLVGCLIAGLLLLTDANSLFWRVPSMVLADVDNRPSWSFSYESLSLSFFPFASRLGAILLGLVESSADLGLLSRVDAVERLIMEVSSNILREKNHCAITSSFYFWCCTYVYVCNGGSPPTFEVAGVCSLCNGDICTRVQTSVHVAIHLAAMYDILMVVMEFLLPPAI